jgi:DNA invertase Pin-like site-specific DNA recombinase
MLIGYARVSTEDQKLDMQLDALRAAGCDEVVTEKLSGAGMSRPGLARVLASLQPGDTLMVWKLDRLGRSIGDLIGLAETLRTSGVNLRSLSEGVDTSSTAGRFFFNVMSSFAQMEREVIRERTLAGLAAARARGRVGGRPRAMTPGKVEAAEKLLQSGTPVGDVARSLGVSVPTIYRYLPVKHLQATQRQGDS